MANLILWRHAEAKAESASGKDIDRSLTKQGHQDAAKMATWLNDFLPANVELICSPARRCQETAAALQKLNGLDIKTAQFLSVNSTVEQIAKEVINTDSNQTILIVGHQPNLGLLIAKVLGMNESACVVKKGAVWWLRQRFVDDAQKKALQTYLFAVQHPDY